MLASEFVERRKKEAAATVRQAYLGNVDFYGNRDHHDDCNHRDHYCESGNPDDFEVKILRQ